MRVTKKTHPEIWDLNKALNPVTHLIGLFIDDEKYMKHREEAERIYPHLSEREREIAAIYLATTHPGFQEEQLSPKQPQPVDRLHTKLLLVAIALIVIVLIFLAVYTHAQEPPQSQTTSLTAIPLNDSAKVKILSLLREQDKLLIARRDRQIEMNSLDKQIAKISDDITQEARELAASSKIDTDSLVLDLDKLAWVSKELPK
jgi:hypothetical protein